MILVLGFGFFLGCSSTRQLQENEVLAVKKLSVEWAAQAARPCVGTFPNTY